MEFEDELKIYGSYEKSITDTKIITGHNNTRYTVGGTARYNIRSNIVDLRMMPETKSIEEKIKLVANILDIDSNTLSNPTKLYDAFIKSLKLNEPINIQLRRLFFILKDRYPSTETTFCQFEPKVRILKLLDEIGINDVQITAIQIEQLNKIISEVNDLCHKRARISKIINIQPIHQSHQTTSLDSDDQNDNEHEIVDTIIDYYKNNYETLYEIENINIQIAQLLEKIAEILEQSEYIT
jgi:hypothetical protein